MCPRAAILALLVCGCSGSDGGACPSDLPAACPTPVPSYQADIAPLIAVRCGPCHAAGGQAVDRPLMSYAAVYGSRSLVLNQVYGCVMPPAGAAGLQASERAALLGWLVCHAPNN